MTHSYNSTTEHSPNLSVWFCQRWRTAAIYGSVSYQSQTISARNHIGHDHISHTKRQYGPKGITILATKMYCYLASIFYKLSVRDSKHTQSRLAQAESKTTQQLSTYFKALWCEYIIARVAAVWATIHCLCSSPTVGLQQERKLSAAGRLTDSFDSM